MARTLIDIPADKLRALDEVALQRDISRSPLVRIAIDEFLKKQSQPVDVFGILKNEKVDGLKLQDKLRSEWE